MNGWNEPEASASRHSANSSSIRQPRSTFHPRSGSSFFRSRGPSGRQSASENAHSSTVLRESAASRAAWQTASGVKPVSMAPSSAPACETSAARKTAKPRMTVRRAYTCPYHRFLSFFGSCSAVSRQLRTPCHRPQRTNVQPVPCHRPVARNTSSLFAIVRSVPLRLPPSGI